MRSRRGQSSGRSDGAPGGQQPEVSGLALAPSARGSKADADFVPSWKKDAKNRNIKVAKEKLELQKSHVFHPLQSPDAFAWHSTSRGIVSDAHDLEMKQKAQDSSAELDLGSRMEQLNAARQTSFGNRVRCMPDNPSRPGDNAWEISKKEAFVSKDAYSSGIVKDLIFGSDTSMFDYD